MVLDSTTASNEYNPLVMLSVCWSFQSISLYITHGRRIITRRINGQHMTSITPKRENMIKQLHAGGTCTHGYVEQRYPGASPQGLPLVEYDERVGVAVGVRGRGLRRRNSVFRRNGAAFTIPEIRARMSLDYLTIWD